MDVVAVAAALGAHLQGGEIADGGDLDGARVSNHTGELQVPAAGHGDAAGVGLGGEGAHVEVEGDALPRLHAESLRREHAEGLGHRPRDGAEGRVARAAELAADEAHIAPGGPGVQGQGPGGGEVGVQGADHRAGARGASLHRDGVGVDAAIQGQVGAGAEADPLPGDELAADACRRAGANGDGAESQIAVDTTGGELAALTGVVHRHPGGGPVVTQVGEGLVDLPRLPVAVGDDEIAPTGLGVQPLGENAAAGVLAQLHLVVAAAVGIEVLVHVADVGLLVGRPIEYLSGEEEAGRIAPIGGPGAPETLLHPGVVGNGADPGDEPAAHIGAIGQGRGVVQVGPGRGDIAPEGVGDIVRLIATAHPPGQLRGGNRRTRQPAVLHRHLAQTGVQIVHGPAGRALVVVDGEGPVDHRGDEGRAVLGVEHPGGVPTLAHGLAEQGDVARRDQLQEVRRRALGQAHRDALEPRQRQGDDLRGDTRAEGPGALEQGAVTRQGHLVLDRPQGPREHLETGQHGGRGGVARRRQGVAHRGRVRAACDLLEGAPVAIGRFDSLPPVRGPGGPDDLPADHLVALAVGPGEVEQGPIAQMGQDRGALRVVELVEGGVRRRGRRAMTGPGHIDGVVVDTGHQEFPEAAVGLAVVAVLGQGEVEGVVPTAREHRDLHGVVHVHRAARGEVDVTPGAHQGGGR